MCFGVSIVYHIQYTESTALLCHCLSNVQLEKCVLPEFTVIKFVFQSIFLVKMSATKEMVDDAIGKESEEEPFETDGDNDADYDESKQKGKGHDDDDDSASESVGIDHKKKSKKLSKRIPKRAPKVAKPSKSQLKKEEQMKLAGFIKDEDEDVIFNINNKLHANGSAVAAAWKRVATKMEKSGKIIHIFKHRLHISLHLLYFFSEADCKSLYRSIKDSLRHKRKKISGKSGDSGDEIAGDDAIGNDESNDYLAFLTTTSRKFPRQTFTMGAGTSQQLTFNQDSEDSIIAQMELDDSSQTSASVYGYVSVMKIYSSILH